MPFNGQGRRSQRSGVKRKVAARNEKAVYNTGKDGKKEGTSKEGNEKLWLKRMDMKS